MHRLYERLCSEGALDRFLASLLVPVLALGSIGGLTALANGLAA